MTQSRRHDFQRYPRSGSRSGDDVVPLSGLFFVTNCIELWTLLLIGICCAAGVRRYCSLCCKKISVYDSPPIRTTAIWCIVVASRLTPAVATAVAYRRAERRQSVKGNVEPAIISIKLQYNRRRWTLVTCHDRILGSWFVRCYALSSAILNTGKYIFVSWTLTRLLFPGSTTIVATVSIARISRFSEFQDGGHRPSGIFESSKF